jgi:hypothetical protein
VFDDTSVHDTIVTLAVEEPPERIGFDRQDLEVNSGERRQGSGFGKDRKATVTGGRGNSASEAEEVSDFKGRVGQCAHGLRQSEQRLAMEGVLNYWLRTPCEERSVIVNSVPRQNLRLVMKFGIFGRPAEPLPLSHQIGEDSIKLHPDLVSVGGLYPTLGSKSISLVRTGDRDKRTCHWSKDRVGSVGHNSNES